jgi:short-subunit dehydrogenase
MSTTARRTALVTGASAGIGRAFAEVYAAHGWDLVVTARRRERLDALARDLTGRHGTVVHVVVEDLADPAAGGRLLEAVRAAGVQVDALVNNAGYAVPGSYRRTTWPQQADFIQVLVTAVCELSHRVLPAMIERRYGRIINVASLAGLLPGAAGHTLYSASKAFLVRFSQSLALETLKYGVHVTAVCPGFTYSEFHDVIDQRAAINRLPRWMLMDAPTVARQGYDASMAGRIVYVNGAVNATIAALGKLLPERLVVGMMARRSIRRE